MSGLQASISTHIARHYYSPELGWHANLTMYKHAVGSHPNRINNLYFTFLFLLRAASRVGDSILLKPVYEVEAFTSSSPNSTTTIYPSEHRQIDLSDREAARILIRSLVDAPAHPDANTDDDVSLTSSSIVSAQGLAMKKAQQGACRKAFDESVLFQVPPLVDVSKDPKLYWDSLYEKQGLREDFRNK